MLQIEGKKIALFVADYFEDLEFWYPYYRMKEAGAEVTVIGPKAESYKGKNGLTARAEKSIDEVNISAFDALIIPGGYSPDHMRRSEKMVKFVKDMNEEGKIIASVCHGPWMLASAGILKGKRITSFFSIKDDMVNAGAKWEDGEAVCDGNIITSRNPNDLPAFCREIIAALTRSEK